MVQGIVHAPGQGQARPVVQKDIRPAHPPDAAQVDKIGTSGPEEARVQLRLKLPQRALEGVILPGVDGNIVAVRLQLDELPEGKAYRLARKLQQQRAAGLGQPQRGAIQHGLQLRR